MAKDDLEIARAVTLQPIRAIAAGLGLRDEDLEPYGAHKAKVHLDVLERLSATPDATLVLVTAMTPTAAGEGKSVTTVGLGDAFRRLGRRAVIALREPSLGPCFGLKGGAAGGGRAQVAPMEDINLHFTGDFHAITAAHNLLAALVDNHLFHGNRLGLDPRRIAWTRVLDVNDRALRRIVLGLGGTGNGVPRESGFEITAASELMAILCLAHDVADLRARVSRIVVGERADGSAVTAGDLRAAGSLAVLLRDALQPNLVQTLEGTPAFVHGGPFGNIAHGCNSLVATRLALKLGDVVVTEAGFATELGAEKFFDIKCRIGGLRPAVAVVVATVRALKMHGGVARGDLGAENVVAVRAGLANLAKHVENVRAFGVPVVVALNHFTGDTEAEVSAVLEACAGLDVPARVSRVWERGGEGGTELARSVLAAADGGGAKFRPLYPDDLPLARKLETIATTLYGAAGVVLPPGPAAELARLEAAGFGRLPICIAKTQSSLSDDPTKLGRPRDFIVTVRGVRLAAGAGFVVAYTGDVLTMPGLPRTPAAETIDLDERGRIVGLF
ncbi:MAG: formate--tetrahydrofolate ligase [Candidatus Rokubacteria bacterium RIFCSPLOWO2_02_FULL_72_37]|nr:MAG: formate--tetrahydrofolate ligase [Candidatus Rokubacteria bacterium RIFCSPLOWO2_02_FULL_72_37]